jgi:hypothetical protein
MLESFKLIKQIFKRKSSHNYTRRLILMVLLWSLVMGWLLSLAINAQGADPTVTIDPGGTVDVVPQRYQLGEKLYFEQCSTCHIALPPEVFPSQTWQDILDDTEQHYGRSIPPLNDPLNLVPKYLYHFSRLKREDEATPYRLYQSRYFLALHPGVKLPKPVEMSSCVGCHPRDREFNFRQLSPEWDTPPRNGEFR